MAIYALGDRQPELRGECWVAESAAVIGSVILGNNVSIWFNSVLRGDRELITIGENTNIQDCCVVHIDPGIPVNVGRNVSVGHHATLHGCTVGDATLIGMKATILNRAVIGKNCIIGAKALIPEGRVIPDRTLVVGTPGRIIRELTDEEVAGIEQSAVNYVNNWKRYVRDFRLIRP